MNILKQEELENLITIFVKRNVDNYRMDLQFQLDIGHPLAESEKLYKDVSTNSVKY